VPVVNGSYLRREWLCIKEMPDDSMLVQAPCNAADATLHLERYKANVAPFKCCTLRWSAVFIEQLSSNRERAAARSRRALTNTEGPP